MTNPTSNFGWQMPTPTDLVTDLPADFEVFGQAVDTSMADLKGGTTGQILSKATNTDMDFTWITNDVGDITAVNVTAPITGGGTSGAVTIGVSAASTSASGVVQLSNSTSTTSSVLASTPTATKSAYDLADAAIAKSTVTTAGDIIYRNATVPVRLGIGTAGQVLTVNSGATAPEWATISGGGWTLASTTTLSGSSTSINIPSGYKQISIWIDNYQSTGGYLTYTLNSNAGAVYRNLGYRGSGSTVYTGYSSTDTSIPLGWATDPDTGNNKNAAQILLTNYLTTDAYKFVTTYDTAVDSSYNNNIAIWQSVFVSLSAISTIQFKAGTGTWAGGTVYLYGVK